MFCEVEGKREQAEKKVARLKQKLLAAEERERLACVQLADTTEKMEAQQQQHKKQLAERHVVGPEQCAITESLQQQLEEIKGIS